jgi:2'-5' RNA ligase
MEQLRAFIAVTLPPEVRRLLAGFQANLKNTAAPVKWVETENLHLTLVFLGNTRQDTVPGILEAMRTAVAGAHSFDVSVTGLGVFPDPHRTRIVWAGLAGGIERLGYLQRGLAAALEPLGFKPENRPFRPHLTLGRVRDPASAAEREALGRAVTGLAAGGGKTFRVEALHLVRSRLTPRGPVYTIIGSAELR